MKIVSLISLAEKHKKKLFTSALGIIFTLAGGIIHYVVEQEKKIERNTVAIQKDGDRILILEGEMQVLDTQVKNTVTRKSWNDYILRKDQEYHEQEAVNQKVLQQLGVLIGRSDDITELLKEYRTQQRANEKAIKELNDMIGRINTKESLFSLELSNAENNKKS